MPHRPFDVDTSWALVAYRSDRQKPLSYAQPSLRQLPLTDFESVRAGTATLTARRLHRASRSGIWARASLRKTDLGERQGTPRADLWIRRCNGLRLRSMRLSDENGRCRPGTSTLGDLQSTTAVPIPAASHCPRSAGPWAGHAIRQGSFRGRPLGIRRRLFGGRQQTGSRSTSA